MLRKTAMDDDSTASDTNCPAISSRPIHTHSNHVNPGGGTNTKPNFASLKGFKKFQAQLARKKLGGGGVGGLQGVGVELDDAVALYGHTPSSSYILGINTSSTRSGTRSGSGGNCTSISGSVGGSGGGIYSASGSGLVGHPEEWVLHTGGLEDSGELLRECCCPPESVSSSGVDSSHSTDDHTHQGRRSKTNKPNSGGGVPPGSLIKCGGEQEGVEIVGPTFSTAPISICPPPPPRESEGAMFQGNRVSHCTNNLADVSS